ncbi:MAG: hypothetical protein NZO58_12245, partial [Gemmataceae bacterium]|nr:hypothetical protein [Gemmataceae bacterium]
MVRHLTAAGTIVFVAAAFVRADAFDHYLNPHLRQLAESKLAQKVEQLTFEQMIDHARVLPGVPGTFLVVKTNDGRWAKLLVQPARHKVDAEKSVPIVLIDRFVTFREGEERTISAKGSGVRLFADFRFNLDYGQVVPAALGGDLRCVADKDQVRLEPVGKAELYLATGHLAEAKPTKSDKVVVGEKFEGRFFNGVYKLY